MEWIKSIISSGNDTANTNKAEEVTEVSNMKLTTREEEDSCFGCSDPCQTHEEIPTLLAMKINHSKPLMGTVKPYGTQLVICTGTFDWEPKIEKKEGTFAGDLSTNIKAKKDSIPKRILLTAGSERSPSDVETDILSFPDMVRYSSIKQDQIPQFVTDALSNNNPETFKTTMLDKKFYILICTHKKRDKRCGKIGPMLIDEFHNSILHHNLQEQVAVLGVSHFGGHKFAGNVIVYPVGVWYGRVTSCHVETIVQKHLIEGKIVKKLLRGTLDTANADVPPVEDKKW